MYHKNHSLWVKKSSTLILFCFRFFQFFPPLLFLVLSSYPPLISLTSFYTWWLLLNLETEWIIDTYRQVETLWYSSFQMTKYICLNCISSTTYRIFETIRINFWKLRQNLLFGKEKTYAFCWFSLFLLVCRSQYWRFTRKL